MPVPIVHIFQPRQRVSWVTWFFRACKHWWDRGPKRSYDGWLFSRLTYPSYMNIANLWSLNIDDIVCDELEVWHFFQEPLKLSFWDMLLGEQNAVVQTPEPLTLQAHWFWIYLRSQTCKFCLHPILQSLRLRDHWCSWWRHNGIYGSQTPDLVYL